MVAQSCTVKSRALRTSSRTSLLPRTRNPGPRKKGASERQRKDMRTHAADANFHKIRLLRSPWVTNKKSVDPQEHGYVIELQICKLYRLPIWRIEHVRVQSNSSRKSPLAGSMERTPLLTCWRPMASSSPNRTRPQLHPCRCRTSCTSPGRRPPGRRRSRRAGRRGDRAPSRARTARSGARRAP